MTIASVTMSGLTFNIYVVSPQAKMKTSALEEIKKVLEEELEEPLRLLKQLLEPFQQAYDFFIQTVKNVKEAWRVIRNGCESDVITRVYFTLHDLTQTIS